MKRNKLNSKTLVQIKLSFNKLIKFCMVAIFLLISIFQPFSASPISKNNKGSFFSKTTNSNQYKFQFDFLAEEETSEEDEIKEDHSTPNTLKDKIFSSQEFHYTASLNTRYLNLVSSRLDTPETPLIVLYHTWKSDLV